MVGDLSLVCLVLATQVRAFVCEVFPSLTNPWHDLSMVTRPSPLTALMHHRFHLRRLLQCATVFMVPPHALMISFAVTLTLATPWLYWSWLYYTWHPWPWLLALALGYLDMDPKGYHLVRATSLASTLATTSVTDRLIFMTIEMWAYRLTTYNFFSSLIIRASSSVTMVEY
jgi:hypothetical protein